MQKNLYILIILLNVFILISVPIAWVEDLSIESSEFQERISELPDSLNTVTRRQQVFDSLIEEKLLLLYSREEKIEVTEEEVEDLFITTFSDHPMFEEEGEFSYPLFLSLKTSDNIQKILAAMQQDIKVEKTRDLIYKKLELSEEELLERFFLEKVKIDVSYAQFNLEEVAVSPQLTAWGARKYFDEHQEQFKSQTEFKLGITYIPFDEFEEEAELTLQDSLYEVKPLDLIMEGVILDSLEMLSLEREAENLTIIRHKAALDQEKKNFAYAEAKEVISRLENGLPIKYPRISTGFLTMDSVSGKIPEEIIKKGSKMSGGEISLPYELTNGLIIYWLIDIKRNSAVALDQVKQEVWNSYIGDLDFQEDEADFEQYFYNHIEEFKVPALVVNRIDLVEKSHGRLWPLETNREEIIKKLEKYLFNEEYLDWAARSSGLEMDTEVIYLEKYPIKDEINRKIAQSVESEIVYGIVESEGLESFFVLNSIYPSYIPEFDEVMKSGYFQSEIESSFDESSFMDYYQSHKKDFTSTDSIAVAGVHFTPEPADIIVDSLEIEEYFFKNQANYYHDKAIESRFLLCKDSDRAELATHYLNNGYDYELIKWCFGDLEYDLADGIVELSTLPAEIRKMLRNVPEDRYTRPLRIEEGWLIVYKGREVREGYYQLSEVEEEIKDKIRDFKADSLAFIRAKTVFDSTTYFGECYSYADTHYIFKTPLTSINSQFSELGNLTKYHSALMQLWKNEKLTQIVQTDNGYAVIFMRTKKTARQLSYEESLEDIRQIFASNYQLERAENYINGLIGDIRNGVNPDSLLYFLGGFKRDPDLTLDSQIPGFEQSSVLIEDMVRHEAGYYSPILKLSDQKLMFYRINEIRKVSKNDFIRQKDKFHQQILKQDYQKWLNSYRQTKRIKR